MCALCAWECMHACVWWLETARMCWVQRPCMQAYNLTSWISTFSFIVFQTRGLDVLCLEWACLALIFAANSHQLLCIWSWRPLLHNNVQHSPTTCLHDTGCPQMQLDVVQWLPRASPPLTHRDQQAALLLYIPTCFYVLTVGGGGKGDANDKIKHWTQSENVMQHWAPLLWESPGSDPHSQDSFLSVWGQLTNLLHSRPGFKWRLKLCLHSVLV